MRGLCLLVTLFAVCCLCSQGAPVSKIRQLQRVKWALVSQQEESDENIQDAIGYSIVTDSHDHVYICGFFTNTMRIVTHTLRSPHVNQSNIFIAKLSPSLDTVFWIRQFTSESAANCRSLALDPSGNYLFATGCIRNTTQFDHVTLVNSSPFLAQLDTTNGAVIWALNPDVARTANREVMPCGTGVTVHGQFVYIIGSPYLVAKYDFHGVLQWRVHGMRDARSVSIGPHGNPYVVGLYLKSQANDHDAQLEPLDESSFAGCYLIKYGTSVNGTETTPQWIISIRSSKMVLCHSVKVSNQGNGMVYISGHFSNSIIYPHGKQVTSQGRAVFVACYDSTGVFQWSSESQEFAGDSMSIELDDHHVFIAGKMRQGYGNSLMVACLSRQDGKWHAIRDVSGGAGFSQAKNIVRGRQALYVIGSVSGTVKFDTFSARTNNPKKDELLLLALDPHTSFVDSVSIADYLSLELVVVVGFLVVLLLILGGYKRRSLMQKKK